MGKSKCVFETVHRELRAKGAAQKELATLIGISEKSLSRKMMGVIEFKRSEMLIIAGFLGKSLDELFGAFAE